MEALHSHSCLPTGEQSGVHDQPQPGESALPLPDPQPPKSPSSQNHEPQTQQTRSKQGGPQQQQQQQQQQHHGQHHKLPNKRERKRLRHQRQSVDSDTPPAEDGKHAKAEATPTRVARTSSGGTRATPSSSSTSTQSTEAPDTEENQEGTLKQKRERKPGKPGKYVCSYCGRACAKPSVLQKHIRSHTGERPYPCAPCGFSFKTKSNLYKHRKSHTHRVKAGLASGEPSALEEPVPESEDETREPLSAASSNMERQGSVANEKTHEDTERSTEQSSGMDNSYAVKKRLAMRLSRGKRGPLGSSDSISSSMGMGSRGSTESGYFSRSESTEQSQDSPPNVTKSAKSYAEIILGKYGRLGHLQRMSRHQDQQPSGSQGQQEKSIPFTVPKKQVIDHITNLITINEAVVDTSKIDSVKPRRFSLSRRSSTESKVSLSLKESPVVHHSTNNPGDPGFKSSGSITMGVPCEKFHHHQSLHVDSTAGQTSTSMAPLLRSLSMPSAASSTDASSGACPRNFRLSQSFDERSETQSRHIGMLRRQPAIELGAEFNKEEHSLHSSSNTLYNHNMSIVPPDHKQCQPEPYECETCGVGCKNWEGYKAHKRSLCIARLPQESLGTTICQLDRSQLIHYPINRPGVLAMRKRRKEESFESDDPSSPVSIPTLSTLVQGRDERSVACNRNSWSRLEQDWGGTSKGFSVIQHTSSFEKQDTLFTESQGKEEAHIQFPSHEDASQKQLQEHSSKPTPRKLVRQRNVQVPEIFITEDSNTNVIESVQTQSEMASIMPKQTKRTEEFQWPQRSLTLSGVPIEKLPPKKKRIRLAEAAQSSGESMSSFDSISLPRSPSQDSCASHASSRSASFEESTRPGDMETLAGIPLRRSRAPNMLTVPGLHHHKREMRRSASEQAPHDPQQQSVLMAMSEMRSKSFDYSSLSPERSAAGWRDRRKCLLMRHTPVRDPEEEEQPAKPAELKQNPSSCIIAKHTALKVNNPSHCSPSPDPVSPNTLSRQSPGPQHLSSAAGSPLSGVTSCNPVQTLCGEPPSQWKLDQSIQLTGHCFEVLPSQKSVESPDPLQRVAPSPLCSGKPVIISLRPVHTYIHPAQTRPVYPPLPLPTQCPLGIARAHYLPISTGLKLEIPVPTHRHDGHSEFVTHPPQILHPHPNITLSPELLRPSISPAVAVVRLQADTNTLASAIYTTLSQTTTYRSQEPVCSALNSGNRNTLTSEHNSHLVKTLPVSIKRLSETLLPVSQLTLPPGNHLALPLPPGSQLWSEEGCRSSGSGSYKRMLSPSNSVDFSPESKQQQKRVKEEEEESCVGNVIAETSSKEEKVEIPTCLPRVCTPISPEGPSYPTLQSTTSHSWCYLNYVKPNPSTSTDQPSVYSSWSTSEYDSNPPGLSTKTALSLLDCKQRVSYTIYTMSPMSSTPAETTPEPADMKTPCPSEVHATLPGDSHRVETTEQEQSAEDKEPKKEREEEEEKEEKEKEEEAQSTSKCREPPPRIWICEGGYRSSEEYVYVRGRGRGRYVCEECGIRCKKPSMLRKHIRLHTDSRPYVCKHCNFAFKTKGNLTKHMKSKAHGKKCHDGPMTGSSLEEAEEGGSEDCLVWPETGQGEHQHSDVSETEEDDDDNEYDDEDDDGEEESWSHEDPSSTSHLKPPKPPNQNRTTPDRDRTRPSGSSQPSQPQRLNPQEPSLCYLAGSPSKKRALFSRRRHLDCAGHRSPRHCPSPTLSPSPSHRLSSSPAPALSPSPSPSHRLSSSPAPALSPSHRLSSSPAPALSPSPSHRLSSSPAPALSPSPSHRLSSSPALSPSPSHCLSSSPAPALSPSPSHRLSSSPSQHLSSSPSHRLSSSPAPALSPSHHLSPAHSLSPRVDLSPLRCPSPRHNLSAVSCHPSHPPLSSLPPSHKLSPAPCHPSPPSSLSLLGCHVSPSLERHPSSLRGLSPIRPKSPSSGSSAPQVTIPAQHRTCLPRDPSSNPHRDRPATATSSKARLMKSYSVQEDDELRPPLLSPRTRPSRGGQGGVLSHLPLHSQQLARTANLLIPIGGIHMVQPRTSPLYSLVTSPVAAKDTPTPARMDQSMTAQNTPTPSEMDRSRIRRAGLDEVPLSWPSSLKDHQNSLKEAARPSTSMHTSYQGNRVGEGEAGAKCRQSTPLPDKAGMAHVHVCTMRPENHGSLSRREETKLLFTGTEVAGSSHTTGTRTSTLSKGTTPTERDTDTHFREGSVFPVTTQGQKALPSFQTKL